MSCYSVFFVAIHLSMKIKSMWLSLLFWDIGSMVAIVKMTLLFFFQYFILSVVLSFRTNHYWVLFPTFFDDSWYWNLCVLLFAAPETPAEVSKASIRSEVWTKLQSDGVTTSSNIFLNRIPNFKGTDEAAQRFSETEEFKTANTICINADKAQEKIQYFTVQVCNNL